MTANRTLSFAALFGAVLALSACSPKTEEKTAAATASSESAEAADAGSIKLLNVSYDVARDFYKEYNPLFIQEYKAKHPGA